MDSEIIFIHNRLMDYRFPLFKILKDFFEDNIEFWFYHDREKYFSGRFFPWFDLKMRLFSRQFYRQFSLSCILELMRKKNFKIIILNGANANYELPLFFLISRLKRKNLVFWTETWNWGEMGWENYIFFKLNNMITRHSDIVLYPGRKVKALYNSLGIPEAKQIFMPNSSRNSDHVDTAYVNKVVQPHPGKFHIVYLARIGPLKGLNYLIEAMKLLPSDKYELLIGGSGNLRFEKRCRNLARKNSNIRFCGAVEKKLVNSFLSIADVYVLPSVHLYGMAEAWGLTINEAVALGKPCVATDMVAAAFDLIEEGKNGFIVKEKNPHALANAVQKATALPKHIVLETCQKKNEEFTYQNMAQGFITAINRLR